MLFKKSFIKIVRRFLWTGYNKQQCVYLQVFLSMFLMPLVIQAVDSPPYHKSEKIISAKKALTKGQEQWQKGELEKALLTLEEAVKLDTFNKQTAKVFKSMQIQKKRIDGLLEKASGFIEKNNYQNAKKSLKKASWISDQYKTYQKVFQKLEEEDLTDDRLTRMVLIIMNVATFQETAATDYAKALLSLSKEKGMEKLHNIDKALWSVELCQVGWKQFFDSAVRIYNKDFDKYPLVAYYNPFTDIFLITVWERGKEGYKIVDAEILLGDLVRGTDKKVDTTPFWLREKKNYAVNLGLEVSLSVLAFEEVFEKATAKNWRSKLKILNDSTVLSEANYPAVSMALHTQLLNVVNFANPKADMTQLKKCRNLTKETLLAVKNGAIDKILTTANETPVETVKILKKITPEWIENLKVAAAVNDTGECFVFLVPKQNAIGSFSLSLQKANTHIQLKRIDLIDYQQIYTAIKSYSDKKSKGGI